MPRSRSIRKDEEYYLNHSIFLVEDTLFKVPTYMLESQSCVFDTLFTLPTYNGEPEGQTDDLPIRLEGIKKADFKLLLKALHPKKFGLPLLSKEEWISLLELSTRWAMDDVCALATENLYKLLQSFPHMLITLGKQYDIHDWIFIGVEMLVRRERPLDEEDVTALGIIEVLKIASIRECATASSSRAASDILNRGRGYVARNHDIDVKIRDSYNLRGIPYGKDRPPTWVS